MEFIKFMFDGLAHFIGCMLILGGIGNFILIMWNRFFRHLNIRKHGYPPTHCDADGDFKVEEKNY